MHVPNGKQSQAARMLAKIRAEESRKAAATSNATPSMSDLHVIISLQEELLELKEKLIAVLDERIAFRGEMVAARERTIASLQEAGRLRAELLTALGWGSDDPQAAPQAPQEHSA
jgi:hypothetical protein